MKKVVYIRLVWFARYDQCDLFQYLAIYNIENLPNNIRNLPKYVQHFAKFLMDVLKFAKVV